MRTLPDRTTAEFQIDGIARLRIEKRTENHARSNLVVALEYLRPIWLLSDYERLRRERKSREEKVETGKAGAGSISGLDFGEHQSFRFQTNANGRRMEKKRTTTRRLRRTARIQDERRASCGSPVYSPSSPVAFSRRPSTRIEFQVCARFHSFLPQFCRTTLTECLT